MWATLSSSTIAKSGSVTDTWSISSALPTDSWTAMGEGTPAGVTALGSYTAYSRTQEITLSNEGALSVSFVYSDGTDALQILGVDLLNSDGNEVLRSDYHIGSTGTNQSHNIYMLDHIASGTYKIRYIINGGITSSIGNITVKHINIKTASSFAEITNWYFIRMHSNQTNYMYYSGSGSSINFGGTQSYEDKYLWGFVKDTDGIRIYNRAAGSSVAIDNANPCTLSASGTSLAFTIGTGSAGNNGAAAGAYFSLFVNPDKSATAKSYLNYRSNGTIQRWSGDDEGSALMIDEVPFSEGRIYTIKAYFTRYTDRYFTNNDGTLAFNTSATNGVKDYWILRSSGNATYPWKFESGRGDDKFLSPQYGLSSTGGSVQINNCGTYSAYHLYGATYDEIIGDIRCLATWSPDGSNKYSGFARTGQGGCWGQAHVNDGYQWSTDYVIEEVTDVDIYTVVCNIPSGGITYTPSYTGVAAQANGGFYILSSAPSASDFTKKEVANYTAGDVVVDATAKTITLNYTANITYTLTDMNGEEYSWSASGSFGTAPTITGCAGYTLDNEEWDEEARTYTADITFPFAVSSNSKTNWTYIGNFAGSGDGYTTSRFCWYVKSSDATKFYSGQDDLPTNQSGELEKWEWSIAPACSAGAFSFTIKNSSTNKYVTMAASPSAGFSNQITLSNTGTAFTFDDHRWKLPTATALYISQNSSSADEQEVGVYTATNIYGNAHAGNNIAFIAPADFTTLLANLKTARALFNQYILYFNNGTYTETVEGTMMTTSDQQATDRNVVKDSPTAYFTAAQFKTYTDNYNNAVAGLNYVMPTGKFIRFKNADGSKYVKASTINYSGETQLSFTAGGTDATSIFYLNASNEIIAYNSGAYLIAVNNTSRVSNFPWRGQFSFLKGSTAGRILVYSSYEPTTWAGENKYWQSNNDNISRVTSSDASDFLIEDVASLPVTISAAKYATLCAPVALEIPEGVKAYYISNLSKTEATLTKLEGTIPAGMPVILYADGISVATTFDFPITTADSFDGTNKLSGQAAAQSVDAGVAYTLQQEKGGSAIGFYPKTAGTIAGFRAYLLASALPSDVKGLRFRFDDADGISTVQGSEFMVNDSEIYNLAGQRLNKMNKGINIINGKKVLK